MIRTRATEVFAGCVDTALDMWCRHSRMHLLVFVLLFLGSFYAHAAPTLSRVLYVHYDVLRNDGQFETFRAIYDREVRSPRPDLVEVRVPIEVDGKRVRRLGIDYTSSLAIVATSEALARSVRMDNVDIPLVFVSHSDPRSSGLIESYAAPGRRATGFTYFLDVYAKRMETIRLLVPNAHRVGVLIDKGVDFSDDFEARVKAAGALLGIDVAVYSCDNWASAETTLRLGRKRGIDAWDIPASHLAENNMVQLVSLLNSERLPALHYGSVAVRHGALAGFRATGVSGNAVLARKLSLILRGVDAGAIPFEAPKTTELSINLQAARIVGVRWSDKVIARADRVFDKVRPR